MCTFFNKMSFISQIYVMLFAKYMFFEKHAKNLNAHSEKFGKLGLTAGI